MMVATFNGNPSVTIISCYNPTNASEETDLIAFYNELSSLVRSIPKHNVLVIVGDINAQIGKNVSHKFSWHNSSNRNGEQNSLSVDDTIYIYIVECITYPPSRQFRIAWQIINEVSRKKSTAKAKLKAANQQERIKLWKQHFENLLGNPPTVTHEPITRIISKRLENLLGNSPKVIHEPITRIISEQLDIKPGPFMQEELDSVLRKIRNRKSSRAWWNTPRSMEAREFDDLLLRHCNAVYNQNLTDRWTKVCNLPFPKKGGHGLAKYYRVIILTSIAAKIYNALLRNRIEPKI